MENADKLIDVACVGSCGCCALRTTVLDRASRVGV
jgi:hypothetical protein